MYLKLVTLKNVLKKCFLFLKLKPPIQNLKDIIVFHNKKVFFVEGLFTQHQSNLESTF